MLGQIKYIVEGRDRVSELSRLCTDFFSKHGSSFFQECLEQNCAVFALTKLPPVLCKDSGTKVLSDSLWSGKCDPANTIY